MWGRTFTRVRTDEEKFSCLREGKMEMFVHAVDRHRRCRSGARVSVQNCSTGKKRLLSADKTTRDLPLLDVSGLLSFSA